MTNLAFLHGWPGLALTYGVINVGLLAGLNSAGAQASRLAAAPLLAVPLTVVCGTLLSAFGAGLGHAAALTFGASVTAALSYAVGCGWAATPDAHRAHRAHRRGALIENAETAPAADRDASVHIRLASRRICARDETKHFKLIGTTGTGKSTAVREILSAALRRGDRAIIADADGAYMKSFYRPERDIVLNPFERSSARWDLFAEIGTAHDVEQLARSLIPEHGGRDGEWREYARTFFTAVTRQAWEAGICQVSELYRLLVIAEAEELRGLVRGTPAQPFLEEQNSRMFDSIRSVTSSAVAALEHIGAQQGEGFSVRQWVSSGSQGVLFFPYKAGQIAALRSSISAWMRLGIFERMSGEAPEIGPQKKLDRLWFVVDELDALGQIDGLKDALARLRKFEGRCILGFQSIAQVSSTYGQGDAHTIIENCANTLILRCSASEGGGTAKFASQLIGEREVVRTSVSRSRRGGEWLGSTTRSEHIALEPAVLPSQVEQLPDLSGFLKCASEPQWRQVTLSVQSDRSRESQGAGLG